MVYGWSPYQLVFGSNLNMPNVINDKPPALENATVSHFSYAPFFQGPYFLTKMLESNILYDNIFIDILSV